MFHASSLCGAYTDSSWVFAMRTRRFLTEEMPGDGANLGHDPRLKATSSDNTGTPPYYGRLRARGAIPESWIVL